MQSEEPFSEALNLYESGDFLEALEALSRISEVQLNDPSAIKLSADIYCRLGRYEEAFEANERAFRLSPDDLSIMSQRASILESLGQYEEALEANNNVMELRPSDLESIKRRIDILENLERHEEALNACEWALSLMPTDPFIWTKRAGILEKLGKYEEALEFNQKASELSPNNTSIMAQHASILESMGRPEEAKETYKDAEKSGLQEQIAEKGFKGKRIKQVNPPRFTVHSRAVSDMATETDLLGFQPLVDGLDALLNNRDTKLPLTIALTAPWGGGKSSLMRQLKASLQQHSKSNYPSVRGTRRYWYTVEFEAWKYDTCERLWAILAKTIYDKVQDRDQMGLMRRIHFRFRLELARFGAMSFILRGLGIPILVAILISLLFVFLGQVLDVITNWGVTAGVLGGGVLAFLVAWASKFWGLIGDPFKQSLKAYCRKFKYEEHLGFTEEASRDISKMMELLTAPEGHALAVFVDDLDRCSPRHVVEIVEAINQIFNSSDNHRCAFILGIDREAVAAGIEAFYSNLITRFRQRQDPTAEDFGLRFLSKIVQLSVAIPPAEREKMKKLLTHDTGERAPTGELTIVPPVKMVQDFQKLIIEKEPLNPVDVERIRMGFEAEAQSLDALTKSALTEAAKQVRAEYFTIDSPDMLEVEYKLLNFLDRNPRQVKRFDNAFRLQLLVASEASGNQLNFNNNELFALGKWVALRLRWPRLAADIDRERSVTGRDLLKELEDQANNSASTASKSLKAEYKRWFDDPFLKLLLKVDKKDEIRITSLPWDSFLRVT